MTMLAQHGILGRPTARLIPTDDTKTFSEIELVDNNRYYLNSLLHQSPKVRSVIVNTFTDGVAHGADATKKIVFRKSTDFGLTYGAITTLYDPTDGAFQVQDPSIGYSNNGRLHILADCHDSLGVPGGNHEIRYMYSDDDGTTVSSPVTVTLPSTVLNAFRLYGRIIDLGNGVLLAPCYFLTDEADFTQSSRYVIRTTDGGANWSFVDVDLLTTPYINEGELIAVTNNIVYYMCRYEDLFQFWCYKSIDGGLTWSNLGAFGTGLIKTSGDPCRLHKFRADNGKWFCAMYFTHRATDTLYAIYGRLDNGVEGGRSLFNITTLTLLRTDGTNYLHYGDMVHYNGNMNCRGAWPREVGTSLVDNQMQYFENLTTQYDAVFAILDPVTIWDKLFGPRFIGSSRGLVSNTTNEYGVVNGSSQITTLKSLAPGPLASDYTATAGGITLSGDSMVYDGTKALTNTTKANWKFLHGSSFGASDVHSTLYFVGSLGTGSNPDTLYGILGNNAGSSGAIGYTLFYDDRSSGSQNNALRLLISKGTVGFIIDFINQNIITPNTLFCLCVEVDLAQSVQDDKVKAYVNGVLQSTTVTTYNSSVSIAESTHNIQIGSLGNNVGIAVMTMKDMVIQNAVDTSSVRDNMILALMQINGL